MEVKSAEEYNLEQKRNELCRAEQDLASIISSAEDFFDSPSDKDAVLQQIQENPDTIIASSAKPFMKKIARAMLVVTALNNEVDEAFEVVADQQLTPTQVKVQILKALDDQRIFLEDQMAHKLSSERAKTTQLLTEQTNEFEHALGEFEDRLKSDREMYEKMLLEQKTLFENKLAYSEGKLASLSTKMDRLFESLSTQEEVHQKTIISTKDKLRSILEETKTKSREIQILKSKLNEFSEDVYMMISHCQWMTDQRRKGPIVGCFELQNVYGNLHKYSKSVAEKYGFGGLYADPQSFISSKLSNLKISKMGELELPVLVDFL
jgi:hypothetical protein